MARMHRCINYEFNIFRKIPNLFKNYGFACLSIAFKHLRSYSGGVRLYQYYFDHATLECYAADPRDPRIIKSIYMDEKV